MKRLFYLPVFISLFLACDIIDDDDRFVIKDISTDCGSIANPFEGGSFLPLETYKKVVLEDYTGHTCPNCPAAQQVAEQLLNQYDDSLYVMAIHTGNFAAPNPVDGFPADYRTAVGDELRNFFKPFGYPIGMINRIDWTASTLGHLKLDGQWSTIVNQLVGQPADVDIQMVTHYDAGSRQLCVDINSHFINSVSGEYYLGVYLLEDSIVSPQVDNQVKIPDYQHNHMLRGAINSTWGERIIDGGTVAADSAIYNRYSFTLDSEFYDEKCSVLAFIYDNATKEIIQSESEYVTD